MPSTDERNIDFSGEDTSLDDLYDDEFTDVGDDEEEDEDEEEKNSSNFESNPNKKKNKIIIWAGVGLLATVLGVGLYQNAHNKKKAAEQQAKQQQQENDKAVTDGTQPGTEGNNLLGQQQTAQGQLDAGAGIPCNTNDPNDPNNVNNPNCAASNGQAAVNPNGQPQQIAQNPNGQPQQIPQDNNAASSGSSYTGDSGTSTSSGNSGNYSGGSVSYSRPARKPKSEKPMPAPLEPFQPKTITKPTVSLGSVSNGQKGGSSNPAAVTTNGTQGQTQAQADAINSTQQRVRPSNNEKKADNVHTFLLSPGTYIPIAMTTTLNSDNPSYFMGIVRENVYSQNGQHKLLIPMGSKVIGNYQALSSNTATRMFMFVEKIIFPNQEVMAFSNVNVVDLQGEIGTRGKLNSRFWQRLGNTTLALTFSAADIALNFRKVRTAQRAAESKNGANIGTSTWEQVLTSPTQTVREVAKTLNDAWMMPKNKIKVPIGARLNVMILDNLVVSEYRGR